MKWFKAAWRKLCPSYGNEKTPNKGYKLVKHIVVAAQDFNLQQRKMLKKYWGHLTVN